MSSRSATTQDTATQRNLKDELRPVATKILFHCVPWPEMWTVSGRHIVATSSLRLSSITASDDLGEEILSYVPKSLRPVFLSAAGQSAVSRQLCFQHCTSKLKNLQIASCMGSVRSSKLNVVRTNASLIFGAPFKPDWFVTNYDRTKEPILVKLSGAKVTRGAFAYDPFPPILFPDSPKKNEKDVFMNPVLIRVSHSFSTARLRSTC